MTELKREIRQRKRRAFQRIALVAALKERDS